MCEYAVNVLMSSYEQNLFYKTITTKSLGVVVSH